MGTGSTFWILNSTFWVRNCAIFSTSKNSENVYFLHFLNFFEVLKIAQFHTIQYPKRTTSTQNVYKTYIKQIKISYRVVKEVQRIFDQQSKKAILNECKNEIPTRGIPSIMDEYFPELDKILQEYLTPQILQK